MILFCQEDFEKISRYFLLHDEYALGARILVLSIDGADKVGIVMVKAMQTAHCAAAVGSNTDYAFPAFPQIHAIG